MSMKKVNNVGENDRHFERKWIGSVSNGMRAMWVEVAKENSKFYAWIALESNNVINKDKVIEIELNLIGGGRYGKGCLLMDIIWEERAHNSGRHV